jgi:class 3 adenylate cyclase
MSSLGFVVVLTTSHHSRAAVRGTLCAVPPPAALAVTDHALVLALALVELLTLAALVTVSVLWVRERRESDELREHLVVLPPTRARQAAGWAVKTVVDTAQRVRERGIVGGLVMAPIEDLTRWATEDREEIAAVAAPDGTVTILFSDIEDSTALNESLGDDAWVRVLVAHDRVVRGQVRRHRGHVVKSQGDGYMVVFGSPGSAIDAARGIQRDVGSAHRRLRRTPLKVRIGIHAGPAVARDGDYFGRNVALAARVAAAAGGGQILVTDDVRESLEGSVPELVEHGEVELKGLTGSHTLWLVAG